MIVGCWGLWVVNVLGCLGIELRGNGVSFNVDCKRN